MPANPPGSSIGAWPKIIAAVTSIMGLTALAILAAGAAFAAAIVNNPKENQVQLFVILILLVLALVFSNMVYAYVIQRTELTFRVRVARMHQGIETPCSDMLVDIY